MGDSFDKTTRTVQGALVLAALAATPLIVFTPAYDQFILPKTVWIESLAIAALALAGLRAIFGRPVGIALHSVNLWIALFLLWHIALIPFAASASLAVDRVGWMLAVGVVCWAWQEWAGGRRRRVVIAFRCLLIVGAVTAAWALQQDMVAKWGAGALNGGRGASGVVNRLGDWRGEITAGFGNTDHIAEFLATIYLPALLLLLFQRGRIRAGLIMIALWLMAAALIVCWSVGNNGSLIIGTVILIAVLGHRGRKAIRKGRSARRRLGVWLAGCALVVVWLVTPNPLNPHRPGIFQEAFSSPRWIAGGPTRGVIWLNALEMIREHQLLGVGPGNFTYVYPRMQSAFIPHEREWLVYQGVYTNAAHDTLLQTWAELGPIGALLLVVLVVAAFRRFLGVTRATRRPLDRWIALGGFGALTVLVLTSIMTFPLQLPASTVLFFALLPLGEMLRRRDAASTPSITSEGRWGDWTVELKNMQRPVRLAGALNPPAAGRIALAALCVAIAAWGVHRVSRPLASDALYNRARIVLARSESDHIGKETSGETPLPMTPASKQADALFRRALRVFPDHHDCRSAYSSFLLEHGRYRACIEQLDRVFQRLDSPELYLRRARAYRTLGMDMLAQRDLATYRRRRPIVSLEAPQASGDKTSDATGE